MHYNLHEKLKPKKHIPYKQLIIAVVVVFIVVALYVTLFRNNDPTPAVDLNKPT